MYKLEVVVLKTPVFWLDSRIMVMNWLWIWIWRLCAPIAKLILSGCLFYKCLSHYHVTSAVQKQRSSIQRPLSPLYHQYWIIKRKEIRIKNSKTLLISVSSPRFAGDLLKKIEAGRWRTAHGFSWLQSASKRIWMASKFSRNRKTGSKRDRKTRVVGKPSMQFESSSRRLKAFRTRPLLSNLNKIFPTSKIFQEL